MDDMRTTTSRCTGRRDTNGSRSSFAATAVRQALSWRHAAPQRFRIPTCSMSPSFSSFADDAARALAALQHSYCGTRSREDGPYASWSRTAARCRSGATSSLNTRRARRASRSSRHRQIVGGYSSSRVYVGAISPHPSKSVTRLGPRFEIHPSETLWRRRSTARNASGHRARTIGGCALPAAAPSGTLSRHMPVVRDVTSNGRSRNA